MDNDKPINKYLGNFQSSTPEVLYDLSKAHKSIVDMCPPFKLRLSAIKTPLKNPSKFLIHEIIFAILELTVKDYFTFYEKLLGRTGEVRLSPFANISIEDTNVI